MTYSKVERYKLSREALRSEFITTNTKGLVISENHRRRPRWYKFEFSFVGNDRQPSQKYGMRREKKFVSDYPRRSEISTISSFRQWTKFGTIGKQ